MDKREHKLRTSWFHASHLWLGRSVPRPPRVALIVWIGGGYWLLFWLPSNLRRLAPRSAIKVRHTWLAGPRLAQFSAYFGAVSRRGLSTNFALNWHSETNTYRDNTRENLSSYINYKTVSRTFSEHYQNAYPFLYIYALFYPFMVLY